jgi:hypothetical protein
MILTTNEIIKKTPEYAKILEVIDRMERTSLLWFGRGQCISMCDILVTALFQAGIKAKMVECQVIVTNKNIDPPQSVSIGYDTNLSLGQIDTHMICITDTDIPMIIDASISYLLPDDKKIMIDQVVDLPNRVFCDIKQDGFELIYQQKLNPKVAFEHQRSILERIRTDNHIFSNLKWLKILVISALAVSLLNATRGAYDFYQKYFIEDNLIGISANQTILERLDDIEKKIKQIK